MKATSKTKKGGLTTRPKSAKPKKATRKRKVIAEDQEVHQKYPDSDRAREVPWRPQYKSKAADEEG